MKKPSVADCLDEVRRLRAENERLKRLVASQRPELPRLRELATQLRDLGFNLPMKLDELHKEAQALLGGDDDLPSLEEMYGCLSDGRDRVHAALESPAIEAAEQQPVDQASADPAEARNVE